MRNTPRSRSRRLETLIGLAALTLAFVPSYELHWAIEAGIQTLALLAVLVWANDLAKLAQRTRPPHRGPTPP